MRIASLLVFVGCSGARADALEERGSYGLRGVDYACAPCGSPGKVAVKASSTLAPAARYGAVKAVDDDPKTAWCEGVDGDGAGSTLTLRFSRPLIVEAVAVWGGYLKSDAVLRNNHRVKGVTVSAGGRSMRWTQPDPAEPKSVDASTGAPIPAGGWLDHVRASEPPWVGVSEALGGDPVESIEVRVDSTWKGVKADDLCISEVDVLVIDPAEL